MLSKIVKITGFNVWGHPIKDTQTFVTGKSMTIKSHAKGLTVNEIMKRFSVTGTIPDRGIPGQFLDSTKIPDMFSALNQRVALDKYFSGLDAVTRGQFKNNPMNLVQFVNDPKNLNKGLQMGLLKLTPEGVKAKSAWDSAQLKKKEADRAAFVADVSQILKSQQPPA